MYQSSLSPSSLMAGTGAAVFLFLSALLAAGPADAQSGTDVIAGVITDLRAPLPASLPPGARANVEPGDEIAALSAVEIALTQAGDGSTYVWRRGNGRLSGAIRPTRTFRDADGRMCRHVEMSLNVAGHVRRTEGIACRDADGVWALEG